MPIAEAAVVFFGAWLLFLVEPLIARMLLPQFGGTAAVWITSLLFFQIALLAGYVFAHVTLRLRWAQIGLLALACLALPVRASPHLLENAPPALRLLALLAQSVGLPFLALATTGPAVQALQARRQLSPYRLYALSNLASALGLLSYPLLFEPLLTLRAQALIFSAGFACFALLFALVVLRAPPAPAQAPTERHALESPALILMLPACTSALLLAITASITQNLAPIPLLWILPLALYLGSFVAAFRFPHAVKRIWAAPLTLVSLAGLAALEGHVVPSEALHVTLAGVLLAFFLISLAAHAELAKLQPHPSELTRYYLYIAAGSVLGSLAVAIVAPLTLNQLLDLPLCIVATGAILGAAWVRAPAPRLMRVLLQSAPIALGLIVWWRAGARGGDVILRARNFYGALSVRDQGKDEDGWIRVLVNGTINHGAQSWEGRPPQPTMQATTYYVPGSGVGRAVEMLQREKPRLNAGIIGLGAGVLAGYCRAGDAFQFYEINPLVKEIALQEFTFLRACAGAQTHLGDARLTLAAEPPRAFDLLVVDAFSSDSIPVHLLTREAFDLFARHLAPDGILAVHVSNRYLDLVPVVMAHADRLRWPAVGVEDDGKKDPLATSSEWILLAPQHALTPLHGQPLVRGPRQLWTDDYSNLITLLR